MIQPRRLSASASGAAPVSASASASSPSPSGPASASTPASAAATAATAAAVAAAAAAASASASVSVPTTAAADDRAAPTSTTTSKSSRQQQTPPHPDREELTVITTRAASLDLPYPRPQYGAHPQTPVSAQPTFNFSRPSPLGRTPQDPSFLASGPPNTRSASSASNTNFPSISGLFGSSSASSGPGSTSGAGSSSATMSGHLPSQHHQTTSPNLLHGPVSPAPSSAASAGSAHIGHSQQQYHNIHHSPHHHYNPSHNGPSLSASQIAAQTAVLQHQNAATSTAAGPPFTSVHSRQRSQTVPTPGEESSLRARSGPLSPPMLSLTEASAPKDSPFGHNNGLMSSSAAATAANAVFPKINTNVAPPPPPPITPGSPLITAPSPHVQLTHSQHQQHQQQQHQHQHQQHQQHQQPLSISVPATLAPAPLVPEKKEKSRKLFSRPGKIGIKDTKERALPSPAKLGSAFTSALQRGNFSSTSLALDVPGGASSSSGGAGSSSIGGSGVGGGGGGGSGNSSSSASAGIPSLYSHANSSSATIRPMEMAGSEKEKEKKHHFLSRQKQKLKDEYHLAASASSTKAGSATSQHNGFQPGSTASKSHHIGRSKDKKGKDDKADGKLGDLGDLGDLPPVVLGDGPDARQWVGVSQLAPEDAWPYVRSKLIVVFEAEEVRVPVEELNRIVSFHLQTCISRRNPTQILEDLKELLRSGFMALDRAMRKIPEDRMIPELVSLWMFTFTTVLPYLQAVFLPLDLEFSGAGTLLSPDQARDFWGAVAAVAEGSTTPATGGLNIRSLVLTAYRDIVILPRYETLKTIFSRLSLEFLPASLANMALASPPPEMVSGPPSAAAAAMSTSPSESFMSSSMVFGRPGTSASGGTGFASVGGGGDSTGFASSGSTLLGEAGSIHSGSRSRAISNVSYGSNVSDGVFRPFTPGSFHTMVSSGGIGPGSLLSASSINNGYAASVNNNNNNNSMSTVGEASSRSSLHNQNVEDSKQVTELVGRMLQCMSVLSSVGMRMGNGSGGGDEASEKMTELSRLLKLNWLGRGRTGRNRRGLVGGRVMRGTETSAF